MLGKFDSTSASPTKSQKTPQYSLIWPAFHFYIQVNIMMIAFSNKLMNSNRLSWRKKGVYSTWQLQANSEIQCQETRNKNVDKIKSYYLN